MRARPVGPVAVGLVVLVSVAGPRTARAGIYADAGVRASRIRVCFVPGTYAADTARAERVRDSLREIEGAAHVRFEHWDECPAPETREDGTDVHLGDVRVALPTFSAPLTGPVPGRGCAAVNLPGGQSWSQFPSDLETNRSCLYNLSLYDDGDGRVPWLNHTLHEFGHALGLRHEHEREDASASCADAGGDGTSYLTRYDTASVMHYKTDSCGINGNYDHTGLSPLDRLSLHILYPEERRVAELVGRTVLRAGERLSLGSAWEASGADIRKVARKFRWRVGGALVSSTARVSLKTSKPGLASLQLSYEDFLGRPYSYRGVVRVLDPRDFDGQMAAVASGGLALMASAF